MVPVSVAKSVRVVLTCRLDPCSTVSPSHATYQGLLAHPEFLHFTREGAAEGRTRVVESAGCILRFAIVTEVDDGDVELEDLFIDPPWHRRRVARSLVVDAVEACGGRGVAACGLSANPQALAVYRAVGFIGGDAVATELGAGLRLHLDV